MKELELLIYAKMDMVLRRLKRLENNMADVASEMAALADRVAKNTSVIASAKLLIQGFKAQLDAAGVDPAKLAALSATLATDDDDLAAAVAASTPAAPTA